MPATKNVELYNPEMDESKPKSEVNQYKYINNINNINRREMLEKGKLYDFLVVEFSARSNFSVNKL